MAKRKKMSKTFWIIIGIIVAVIIFIIIARGVSGEDNWICSNGQWVKHGNPSAEMPSTPCPQK